jgi:GAF domain-containing protein
MHYPISQAGVWVDCVYQRQAVICNDYVNHPRKKNLPEGHAPLFRFATIPLFRQEKIVAIISLGNKEVDYTQSDVDVITRIVDVAYDRLCLH